MHFVLSVMWQALSKQESQNKCPEQFYAKICNMLRCGYEVGIILKRPKNLCTFLSQICKYQ